MDMRRLIAENLNRMMRTAEKPKNTARGLAAAAGIGRRTVDRIRKPVEGDMPPSLSTLVALANALEAEVWHLLITGRQPAVRNHHGSRQENVETTNETKRHKKGR